MYFVRFQGDGVSVKSGKSERSDKSQKSNKSKEKKEEEREEFIVGEWRNHPQSFSFQISQSLAC